MICGVLIVLIIFPRHPHDNMHHWYSRPHCQDSLPLSLVCFFPNFGDVLVLWLLTSSVSLPQNRRVRCVLSESLHACLRTWTWHILSRCSSHSKPILTIKWNMHAQLYSHSPSSGPLQTRLKKSCARFSTVNRSQVRQFWNKLAYSHNLGWEIRSYRDIPWTTESGSLAAEANYSAFYLFYVKYLQTEQFSVNRQGAGCWRHMINKGAEACLHCRCPRMFTCTFWLRFPACNEYDISYLQIAADPRPYPSTNTRWRLRRCTVKHLGCVCVCRGNAQVTSSPMAIH